MDTLAPARLSAGKEVSQKLSGVTLWRSAMKHTASSAHSSLGKSVICSIVLFFLLQSYAGNGSKLVTIKR